MGGAPVPHSWRRHCFIAFHVTYYTVFLSRIASASVMCAFNTLITQFSIVRKYLYLQQ